MNQLGNTSGLKYGDSVAVTIGSDVAAVAIGVTVVSLGACAEFATIPTGEASAVSLVDDLSENYGAGAVAFAVSMSH